MSREDTVQYRLFIQKLQRDDDRPEALTEIKNMFSLRSPEEAVSALRDVGISKIVECLNSNDKAHVDLTCEVLKVCFEKFSVGEAIKNFVPHIMHLLRHQKSCVRQLAINEVYTAVMTDPDLLPVYDYIDVYVAAAQMVCDDDLGVANKAIQITSNLPYEAYSKVLDEMKIALQYNNSCKCNAFEVVINMSAKSHELFKLCAEQGYIEAMLTELDTNDILYQLNILELLARLAVTPHGITYLIQQGALQKIATLIEETKDQPLANLLIPGYIKFFGNIAHHYPKEIFSKYPILMESLFDALDSSDPTVMPVALDTLGYVGMTIEGKLCLAALGNKYTQAIEKVTQIIRNSPSDLKVRAIHCFANLISVDQDPNLARPRVGPTDHRVTLMTREWFRCLSTNSMEKLVELCKNPFPDIQLAAFSLLESVCQHQWGEEAVARTAGFVEFLLDRTTDHTKETKEMKYDVMKRLSRSPAFDENIISRLQLYVEQGPFFSESNLGVAMEGEE